MGPQLITKILHVLARHLFPLRYLFLFYLLVCVVAISSTDFQNWVGEYIALFLMWTFSIQFFQSTLMLALLIYNLRIEPDKKSSKNYFRATYKNAIDSYAVVATILTVVGGAIQYYWARDIFELLAIFLSAGVYVELLLRTENKDLDQKMFRDQLQVLYGLFVTAIVLLLCAAFVVPALTFAGWNIRFDDPIKLLYLFGIIYFSFKFYSGVKSKKDNDLTA